MAGLGNWGIGDLGIKLREEKAVNSPLFHAIGRRFFWPGFFSSFS